MKKQIAVGIAVIAVAVGGVVASTAVRPKPANGEFDVQGLNDQVQGHEARITTLESKPDSPAPTPATTPVNTPAPTPTATPAAEPVAQPTPSPITLNFIDYTTHKRTSDGVTAYPGCVEHFHYSDGSVQDSIIWPYHSMPGDTEITTKDSCITN